MSQSAQRASEAASPAHASARAFRTILTALAEPGLVRRFEHPSPPPEPLSPAAATMVATLVDWDARLWLAESVRTPNVEAFLRFRCGAEPADEPCDAAFALGRWEELRSVPTFAVGSPEYPDRGVTWIVEIDGGSDAEGALRLSGPGVDGARALTLEGAGTAGDLAAAAAENAALFPLGIDRFFTFRDAVVGLPRSARLSLEGGV